MSGELPTSGLSFRIHHTMLPVADLERAIDFYTRLLGMRVMARRSDPARMVEVGHVGYGERATQPSIELIQAVGGTAPDRVPPTGGHISLHVSDLPRLCAMLEQEGVAFKRPLMRSANGSLRAWICDPDGHELELGEPPRAI